MTAALGEVVDYSEGYPGAPAIRRAGKRGAVRYLRKRNGGWGKPLTREEAADFAAHGVELALIYQDTSDDRILEGFAAGASDARYALEEAARCGVYVPRCIYFAVDREILTAAHLAAAMAYLDGAASVLGLARVGVYGQFSVIEEAVPRHATFGMQPVAWSRGLVSAKARLLQLGRVDQVRIPSPSGILCDRNLVLNNDWGQVMQIIPREAWGARYSDGAASAPVPYTEIWLHHSAGLAPDLVWTDRDGDGIEDDEVAFMRHLEQIGQDRFGAGISYTWPIFPSGRIYEGHGVDRQGTHTGGRNDRARAICFVGNYEDAPPTTAQMRAAAWLLQHEHAAGHRTSLTLTGGHRDVKATKCPGDAAYALIPAMNKLAAGAPITSLIDPIAVAPPQTEEDIDMERIIVVWGKKPTDTAGFASLCGLVLPGPDGRVFEDISTKPRAREDADRNTARTDVGKWDEITVEADVWDRYRAKFDPPAPAPA